LKELFIGYGVLTGAILILVTILWPNRKYQNIAKSIDETPSPSTSSPESKPSFLRRVRVAIRSMITPHYLFLVLFVPFMVLKTNFFLSTSYQQLTAIAPNDPNKVNNFNAIFGIMLPVVGLLAGPIGFVIDKFGLNAGIILCVIMSCVSSGCGLVMSLDLQIFRFILFSAYFPYIYALWCSFIAMKFGFENYGILYGLVAICAGLVNLASTPISNYALQTNDFFLINLIFLAISATFLIYPLVCMAANRICPSKSSVNVNINSDTDQRPLLDSPPSARVD